MWFIFCKFGRASFDCIEGLNDVGWKGLVCCKFVDSHKTDCDSGILHPISILEWNYYEFSWAAFGCMDE